jgi:hypothetical protein
MDTIKVTTPKDLRSGKPTGRPSNEDRSSITALKDSIRKTCADVLYSIKKEDIKMMTVTEKMNYLGKMLPFIIDDDTQTAESVTMGMLVKKAMMVDIQIKSANESAKAIEEDNGE